MSKKTKIAFVIYTMILFVCVALILWERLLLLESRALLARQLRYAMLLEVSLKHNSITNEPVILASQGIQDSLVNYFYDRKICSPYFAVEAWIYCDLAKDRLLQNETDKFTVFYDDVINKHALGAGMNYYNTVDKKIASHMFRLFYPKQQRENRAAD